jgi:hypothetical protein
VKCVVFVCLQFLLHGCEVHGILDDIEVVRHLEERREREREREGGGYWLQKVYGICFFSLLIVPPWLKPIKFFGRPVNN